MKDRHPICNASRKMQSKNLETERYIPCVPISGDGRPGGYYHLMMAGTALSTEDHSLKKIKKEVDLEIREVTVHKI